MLKILPVTVSCSDKAVSHTAEPLGRSCSLLRRTIPQRYCELRLLGTPCSTEGAHLLFFIFLLFLTPSLYPFLRVNMENKGVSR